MGEKTIKDMGASVRNRLLELSRSQTEQLTVKKIKEDAEYGGQRVTVSVRLAGARINLQIDVGFGDAIVNGPTPRKFPVLLDHPAPELMVYSAESSIAEKFEAMVRLGLTKAEFVDKLDDATTRLTQSAIDQEMRDYLPMLELPGLYRKIIGGIRKTFDALRECCLLVANTMMGRFGTCPDKAVHPTIYFIFKQSGRRSLRPGAKEQYALHSRINRPYLCGTPGGWRSDLRLH
jgi:hypothetical protein